MRLDLLPQARHPDVDAAVERVAAALVREIEKTVARQHAVRIAGKRLQQVELHGRDRHIAAVEGEQPARIEVEHAAAEPDVAPVRARLGHAARLHSPQHAPDPRQELARIERLRDIVVGAELEPTTGP